MRHFALCVLLLSSYTIRSQCSNNNQFWESIAVPSQLGSSVTTQLYGGEYSRITGLVEGNIYTIETCGNTEFDTEITLFAAGSNNPVAYNDDFQDCGNQSVLYYAPMNSGSYDLVLDEYPCSDNFNVYTDVRITLVYTPDPVITIPVVVHVIYNTSAQNISDAQIASQIAVLNEDFRRENSDVMSIPSRFRGFSSDMRFEFCLATMDPDGNPTDGITRTQTNKTTFETNDEMKFTSSGGIDAWPTEDYLNIWVCNISFGILGYATFPGGNSNVDGVVVRTTAFGTTGNVESPNDRGRTATHEVGHWLNLQHVWGDGGCSSDDDVNDTPIQNEQNYQCPSSHLSCNNEGLGGDMTVNYMDYVDDECMVMFTVLQFDRALTAFNDHRSSLSSSTGCSTGLPPESDFSANITTGPAPLTVNFTDQSTGSVTEWEWTFSGATNPFSEIQNPSGILYETPGTYPVKLKSINGWGDDETLKFNYITVSAPLSNEAIASQRPQVGLWPNPVQVGAPVKIKSQVEILAVTLYNSLGIEVPVIYDSKLNQIRFEDAPAGVYSILFETTSGDHNEKLVITN